MTDKLGEKFLERVANHRKMDKSALTAISSARIYLADEALQLNLIDAIGYLSNAVYEAKELAGLSKEAKVVIYRRNAYPNDNLYNTSTSWYNGAGLPLVDLHLLEIVPALNTTTPVK